MGGLFAWLGTVLSTLFGSLFTGWRTWLGAVALKLILAVVLYNLVAEVIGEVLTWVGVKMASVTGPEISGGTLNLSNFSGLLGWLASVWRVPEQFAVASSVIIAKWGARKIPLIRW